MLKTELGKSGWAFALLARTAVLFAAALALAWSLGLGAAQVAYAEGEGANALKSVITVECDAGGTLEFTITGIAGENGTPGTATLSKGADCKDEALSLGMVQQTVGGMVYDYVLTAVGPSAFKGNTSLVSIELTSDLTGVTPAVGANAFEGCTSLKSVKLPQKVAGIGDFAFSGCTALSSVSFENLESAEVYPNTSFGNTTAIGQGAFQNCSALKTLVFPALGAERKGDVYGSFSDYNPGSIFSLNDRLSLFPSGYLNVTGSFPNDASARAGFMLSYAGVFEGCSSLETVVFKAGSNNGAFAYFNAMQLYNLPTANDDPTRQRYYHFEGCTNLKSVVFEAEQSYAGNPNASLSNGIFKDLYASLEKAPTLYYAVNYYGTASEADTGDDAYASKRIARVEYARGTSTSAIATSDDELADTKLADAGLYASADASYSDGIVPDPNETAAVLGLDASKQWVWKLTGTQSRRAALSESCSAYLAESTDLSFGRVDAQQIASLYVSCDQNLSKGSVQDTAFDADRFADPNRQYQFKDGSKGKDAYTISDEAWFTLDSAVEESFFGEIEVVAADGTVLDPDSYVASFQRYDSAAKSYQPAELGEQDGPLLMTITPSEDSGYTGVLQEWVLVKGHSGSAKELYTESSTDTWNAAIRYDGSGTQPKVRFSGPYAVSVGSKDATSALVAAGYAGLTKAPISVGDTESASYGFSLATSFGGTTGEITGGLTSFSNDESRFDTSSAYAAAVYQAFNDARGKLGVSASAYPWGDTAVLVAPDSVNDVAAGAAAYAYAKKAPVFYAEQDGSVSEATLACLQDFAKVSVIGDASMFSDDALDALKSSVGGGAQVARICGDERSASSLSLAVAQALVADGLATCAITTVTDATDPVDAIGALNLSGHEGGITLVSACTADSKSVSAFLRERRDEVETVRLFGRDASNISSSAFDVYDALCDLWMAEYEVPAVGAGDTLALGGAQFSIGDDGKTLTFVENLWPHAKIEAGTYRYSGVDYALGAAVDPFAPDPVDPDKPTDPDDPINPDDPDDPDKPTDPDDPVVPDPDDPNQGGTTLGPIVVIPGFEWTQDPTDNGDSGNSGTTSNGGAQTQKPSGQPTISTTPSTSTSSGTQGTTSSGTTSSTTTRSSGTVSTGTSGTSGTAGALNLNLDTSEEDEETDGWLGSGVAESGQDNKAAYQSPGAADAWANGDYGSDGVAGTGGSASLSPTAVGAIVAAVVVAIGVALWYALRRRPGEELELAG